MGPGPPASALAFGPPFAPDARFFFALPASGLLERVFARGLTASSGVVPAEAGITKPVCLFFVQLYFAIFQDGRETDCCTCIPPVILCTERLEFREKHHAAHRHRHFRFALFGFHLHRSRCARQLTVEERWEAKRKAKQQGMEEAAEAAAYEKMLKERKEHEILVLRQRQARLQAGAVT